MDRWLRGAGDQAVAQQAIGMAGQPFSVARSSESTAVQLNRHTAGLRLDITMKYVTQGATFPNHPHPFLVVLLGKG